MDARDLKYQDGTFDLAIDKSTIDAVLCGEKSFVNVAIMIREIQRVLKVGGIYMIISYGPPENRLFHLEREHLSLDISIYTIKKDYEIEEDPEKFEKTHYVYICRKKPEADEASSENFNKVIERLYIEEKIEEDLYEIENENKKEEEDEDDEEEEPHELILESDLN